MSFMGGGAECGPANPLASLSKVAQVDNSLQRDRFVQQGPSGSSSLRHLASRPGPSGSQQSQQSPQQHQTQQQQQPFDLASLQHALVGGPGPQQNVGRVGSPAWRDDFRSFEQQQRPGPPAGWEGMEAGWDRSRMPPPQQHMPPPAHLQHQQHHPADLNSAWEGVQAQQPQLQQHQHQQQSGGFQQQPFQPMMGGIGMMGGGLMGGGGYMLHQQQHQQQQTPTALDKGKGREVAWDAEFDSYAAQTAQPKEEGAKTAEPEPEEKSADPEEKTTEDDAEVKANTDELEAIWKEHRDKQGLSNEGDEGDLRSWEAEFSQFVNGDVQSAYEELEADEARRLAGEGIPDDVLGTVDATGFPRLGEYTFETKNPYLQHPDPLAHARALAQTGASSLSERALAIEAALQSPAIPRDSLEEAAAWKELGDVQTQDEKETAGSRALERSIKVYEQIQEREKAGGEGLGDRGRQGMGEALMSLAISYTNEAYDQAAYLTLHRQLSLLHPEAARPLPAETFGLSGVNQVNPWAIHGALTESFLQVAREQQAKGIVDPTTQMALGLLYYSNAEYEMSADCWGAALSVTPQDFLLWNRLGATLANGGRPEEAIDAYRHAMELNPTFTRALYNLGVSCLNIGVYQEAAEHLLSALSLHHQNDDNYANSLLTKAEQVNQSQSLWSTLRRALFSMDRPDLAEKAVVGADLSIFAKEFEF